MNFQFHIPKHHLPRGREEMYVSVSYVRQFGVLNPIRLECPFRVLLERGTLFLRASLSFSRSPRKRASLSFSRSVHVSVTELFWESTEDLKKSKVHFSGG